MLDTIFGLKIGIKAFSHNPIDKGVEVKPALKVGPETKVLMNIPPAEDILEFSYPPESPFDTNKVCETSFKS